METSRSNAAARLRETIRKTYGSLSERALTLYGLAGTAEGKSDPLYGGPGTLWSTDTGFRCPSTEQVVWHAAAGVPRGVHSELAGC